jgi:D-alanyl-D-alanine dipeptidase
MAITIQAGTNFSDNKAPAQDPIPLGGRIDDFHARNRMESTQTIDPAQRTRTLHIKVADTRSAVPDAR